MTGGLFELAIIISIAAALGILAKIFKQPIILAYLATGIIIGSLRFFSLSDQQTFKVFSDLGIMFLLFLVGLEINYTSLRLVGRPSVIIGLCQIFFTFILGFVLALVFNFDNLSAAYISFALTLSSTIIIVKLLSDKKEQNSLYGKISIGVLLVQDMAAILVLVLLSGMRAGGAISIGTIFGSIAKGAVLFALMFLLGRRIFPMIFDKISRSHELLFLTSLAWLFLLAAFVSRIGFSVEIAGFLAGLALANSSEHFQIASKIRSLRDFFLLIFFALLGSSIVLVGDWSVMWPVLIFSVFVLIGNPLIVLIVMGAMGYRKRTSFMAGITVAQVSEFSLVLAALGMQIGHITLQAVALITWVGVITIAISSYMIVHAEKLFKRLHKFLSFFERELISEDDLAIGISKKPIILIGFHRTGQSIAALLNKKDLLVIEFDPDMVNLLRKQGYSYIFGDMVDSEILETANLYKARLVISTSPDLEDNLTLLSETKRLRKHPKLILRAETEKEAEILYERGADYVLLPYMSSGHYLGRILALDPQGKSLRFLRQKDRIAAALK